MVYAGIYGSSLVTQDKSLLKNLGMSQNKLLAAQEQRGASGNQVMRKRRSNSKAVAKNVKKHYEHLVVNGQNDQGHNGTVRSSQVFESGANASTKRGAFGSDVDNSLEISGLQNITTNSNQPQVIVKEDNQHNMMIQSQEGNEQDLNLEQDTLVSPKQEDEEYKL